MWILFESDDGWCTVHEKNVLQAGSSLKVGDKCTYFYQGQKYDGTILMKDNDNDACRAKLTELQKMKSKGIRKIPPTETSPLPPKRRIHAVNFYSSQESTKGKRKTDSKTPMSEEEKKRQRLLELNKKEAAKRANNQLLSKMKGKSDHDKDPSWQPMEDDSSQDSIIQDVLAHGLQVKETRTSLLKKMKDSESGHSSQDLSIASPAKDEINELRRQNEMLQIKLQMALDQLQEGKPKSGGTSPERSDCIAQNFNDDDGKSDSSPLIKAIPVKANNILPDSYIHGDKSGNSKDKGNETEADELFGSGEDKEQSVFDTDARANDLVKLNRSGDPLNLNHSSEGEDLLGTVNMDAAASSDQPYLYQLYGKQNDTTELCRNIYCKSQILTLALTNSSNIQQLVRRLILGVFIPSKVTDCTVTGQPWRVNGPAEPKKPLHQGALKAIVEFSNCVAKKKKWQKKTFKELKQNIAGRLIEIKKGVREGKIKD